MPSSAPLLLSEERWEANPTTLPDIFQALDQGRIQPLCFFRRDPVGYDRLLLLITEELIELNTAWGDKMTPPMIERTARTIIRDYPHLTPDDIRLFAERACSARYGHSYGALSPATILSWLGDYTLEREQAIEEEAYAEHQALKEQRHYTDAQHNQYWSKLLRQSKLPAP